MKTSDNSQEDYKLVVVRLNFEITKMKFACDGYDIVILYLLKLYLHV